MSSRTCSIDGCERKHDARGLCAMHRMRMVANGSTELAPKPTAEERFWAKVDKSQECWLWTGALTAAGYGEFSLNNRPVASHRFAYENLIGPIPSGLHMDHRTTCPKSCVNPDHLRPVTRKQNMENRAGPSVRNRCGVRGVWFYKNRWVATVVHNRRQHYVGRFVTLEEAEAAVLAKRNELFTHNDLDRGVA